MLVNMGKDNKSSRVKFVSYTGHYPNLCSGDLTLEIDGERCTFGWGCDYPCFWQSGGYITNDYDSVQGEWRIDVSELPEKFKGLADEIDRVFNENVEYGCCGGCI